MSNADADAAEAARALAAKRWGNQAVVRAGHLVLERHDELPADLRERLHQVTEEAPDGV